MIRTNMWVGAYLALTSLCTFSRTSTMWKLNAETGKIQTLHMLETNLKSYSLLDEDMMYNLNAMADVYSRDETFVTIVSTIRRDGHDGGWLRQSAKNSLESLLEARKIKSEAIKRNTLKARKKLKTKLGVRNRSESRETLDCGQPVNYTHYDYINNLIANYKHKRTPLMPEPDLIYFFSHSHDKENNFNIETLERNLKKCKKENPTSAKLYHRIGNYWRIIGDPVQAVKCFRRSLDLSPAASEVMYDLAKVLYNLQYLDDALYMARRSIELQSRSYTAWRQYFLLGDILKTYGDLRGSVHYYRMALELNPTHELILKTLNEAENSPSVTLHEYTIAIIVALVIVVVFVIIPMMSKVGAEQQFDNGSNCGSFSDSCDVKPQRHFNRALAMRSLKGMSTTRYSRQRKN